MIKYLFSFLILALLILSACSLNKGSDIEAACLEHQGKWLAEYNECESGDREWCSEAGGEFQECASACRHDEGAVICTLQCIQVCKF